ncbi:MAG: hypothetical protein U0744_15675 [Gemmataceae bacterium]
METQPTAPNYRSPAKPQPTLRRVARPRTFDFLCILAGACLSAWVAESIGAVVHLPVGQPSAALVALMRALPFALLLPSGIIAMWPIYYTNQRILGRNHPITAGEWLFGFAWLGILVLILWTVWRAAGAMPEALKSDEAKRMVLLVYSIAMLAFGAIAFGIWVVGWITRWKQPWTHMLALALMMWPAVPLACIWAYGLKLE